MANNYDKIKIIGSGSFGRAWLVTSKRNNVKYVMKEIRVTGLTETERERTVTEVEVLARCRHVNIIRYKEAWVKDGTLSICMEYATEGDLYQKIQAQKGTYFTETVILDWFVQICFALRYIHGQKILHRDLKSQNIFVSCDERIKVGDFGIARVLENTDDHAITAVGTPYYLSPEICQRKPYNHKSDMWSLGCVLYELSSHTQPFHASDFSLLIVEILHAKYKPIPRQYSVLIEDLVAVLLRTNPDDRPSAEQILCVPSLQPYINKYVQRFNKVRESSVSSPATPNKTRPAPDNVSGTPNRKQSDVGGTPTGSQHVVSSTSKVQRDVTGTPQSSAGRCSTPVRTSVRSERRTPVSAGVKRLSKMKRLCSEDKENIEPVLSKPTPNKQIKESTPVRGASTPDQRTPKSSLRVRNQYVNSDSDHPQSPSTRKDGPKMSLHREVMNKQTQDVTVFTDKQTTDKKINKQGTYVVPSDVQTDVHRLIYERNVMNSAALFRSIEEVQAYLQDRLGVLPYKASMDLIKTAYKNMTSFRDLYSDLDEDVLPYFPLFMQLLQLKWVANI